MAQIRMDKKEEGPISVEALKKEFSDLQTKARAFMTSHKFMKPKERVQKLQELTGRFQRMTQNMEKFKAQPTTNPAVKFSFEVFRQSYNSFIPKWKRFEAEMLAVAQD